MIKPNQPVEGPPFRAQTVAAKRHQNRSVDGFLPRSVPKPVYRPKQTPKPVTSVASSQSFRKAPTMQVRTEDVEEHATPSFFARLASRAKLALTIIVALVAGIALTLHVALGLLLVLVYAIIVIALRAKSSNTFLLALIAFGCLPVLVVVRPGDYRLMSNFAIYAFLLLLVAVILMAMELWRDRQRNDADTTTDP